ncbi:MAG TPA: hypothetical protein VKB54_11090 [Solirubrobacteraceae bacterium]|nr:hypothetical protein [Solirubrobacteraceae bacterium]
MPTPREVHRGATRVLSALMVLIGIALLVRSLAGGVWLGLVLGILFVAAGAGRLYLTTRGGR